MRRHFCPLVLVHEGVPLSFPPAAVPLVSAHVTARSPRAAWS